MKKDPLSETTRLHVLSQLYQLHITDENMIDRILGWRQREFSELDDHETAVLVSISLGGI